MVFKEICQGTIISLNFFFLKRFLIISELQTEKMNEFTPSAVVAMKVLWEAREKVLLFLQTLNKYVPYCFDASCDQNNAGLAIVLSDQEGNDRSIRRGKSLYSKMGNAIGKRGRDLRNLWYRVTQQTSSSSL